MPDSIQKVPLSKIQCLTGSALTLLALTVNLDLQEDVSGLLAVIKSCKSIDIADTVIFLLLFYFYQYAYGRYTCRCRSVREKLCCQLPAALFAVFMVLGYSFYTDNSWDLTLGNTTQLIKSLIAISGWYILFINCIICLYDIADRLPSIRFGNTILPSPLQAYLNALQKYPFHTCFLTLLTAYIPCMILSYPGIFTYDTKAQLSNIYQGLNGKVTLRNQHPIAHSMLMYLFANAGQRIFSSANIGMFLYSLFQFLLLIAALSWMIKLLFEIGVPRRILILLILFFILAPTTQNYMFTCVKDVPYCAVLTVFLVQLFRTVTGYCAEGHQKIFHRLLLIASAAGMFFLRQDGIYLLLITFLAFLMGTRENRRLWGGLFIGFFCLFLFWHNVFIPAFQIRPSSRREMLSIPFQQTARYVRDAGDEITEKEAAAISAILDYENLSERYNPNLSDQVKGTFNDDATSEEMTTYFRVWFQMLLKHPDIYIQATMNNLYGYFYPNGYPANVSTYSESEEHMLSLNDSLADYGTDFHYPPALGHARNLYESFREAIFSLPVLSCLRMPAFYVWILLLWIFYCIQRQRYLSILMATPMMVSLLVCMAGPAYGWYFRYLFAMSLCLPATILAGLYIQPDKR